MPNLALALLAACSPEPPPTLRVVGEGGSVALGVRSWGRDGALGPVDERLVEWWKVLPDGLEQGFTVSPPAGPGPLVVELVVTGAEVRVHPDLGSAVFSWGAGRRLFYSHLAAWDAVGRDLPARMEHAPGGLRLVIDDAGAVGENTIDPLLNETWSAELDQDYAHVGDAVGSAGDVNGDGYGDLAVGATWFDDGQLQEGRAVVFHGSAAGLGSVPDWTADGDQANAHFGTAVGPAGDVNGDGYDDVIVGTPDWDGGQNAEGGAWLYLGSASGLAATAAWADEPDVGGCWFGWSVSTAGTSTPTATTT